MSIKSFIKSLVSGNKLVGVNELVQMQKYADWGNTTKQEIAEIYEETIIKFTNDRDMKRVNSYVTSKLERLNQLVIVSERKPVPTRYQAASVYFNQAVVKMHDAYVHYKNALDICCGYDEESDYPVGKEKANAYIGMAGKLVKESDQLFNLSIDESAKAMAAIEGKTVIDKSQSAREVSEVRC